MSTTSNFLATKPVLSEKALYGLGGEIAKTIDPYTEADIAAVLTNILVGFGNIIGRGPYFQVEETQHFTNLNAVYVGTTSKGRKGQSWSTVKKLYKIIDSQWSTDNVTSGLSSGEGLIYQVRDPNGNGAAGVYHKRLLIIESEFSQPLKMMKRPGNILSPTLREAWDGNDLHPLTKNNPLRASTPHISIIGHITKEELLRQLTETEMGNGFANRFIWLVAERSKSIPSPTGVPRDKLKPLTARLLKAVKFARSVREMKRSRGAEIFWASIYINLSEGKPGLVGAVISRAEAQVLRLSMIYALLDHSKVIKVPHLDAAFAFWEYSEECVKLIFGDSLGDPIADRILVALRQRSSMNETNIRDLFGRNRKGAEIDNALGLLCRLGLASSQILQTGGRPQTIWQPTT